MLLDRPQLLLTSIAPHENGRYFLTCVHVDKDGTAVATDGRSVLAVEPDGHDPDDLPVSVTPCDNIPDEGVNIPVKLAADVAKRIRKKCPARPILNTASVTRVDKDSVELGTTDLVSTHHDSQCVPDGLPFPKDWRDMARISAQHLDWQPHDDIPGVTAVFDARRLGQALLTLASIADAIGASVPSVSLTLTGSEQPIRLEARALGRRIYGAVAPLMTK